MSAEGRIDVHGHKESSVTEAQEATLRNLCERYGVEFNETDYRPAFDLPTGYVAGWVGGQRHANPQYAKPDEPAGKPTIYVGVSPEGNAAS